MKTVQNKYLGKYTYSIILLQQLVKTEFKLRYQGSVLGYVWSLLRPLFLFVILYFVFVHFLRIGADIPGWPLAMLLGIVMWQFFAEVTNNGLSAVVSRGDVIRKINFPKYVIVLASGISALINLVINLFIIAIFMIFTGISISWSALLVPFYILELFVLGLGFAFMLSALYVKLRDVNHIWEIFMQALFYGSAVIYPIAMVQNQSDFLAKLLLFNPITQAIQGARHALISPAHPTLMGLTGSFWLSIIPVVLTILIFIAGALYFKKRSPHFAEEI